MRLLLVGGVEIVLFAPRASCTTTTTEGALIHGACTSVGDPHLT